MRRPQRAGWHAGRRSIRSPRLRLTRRRRRRRNGDDNEDDDDDGDGDDDENDPSVPLRERIGDILNAYGPGVEIKRVDKDKNVRGG